MSKPLTRRGAFEIFDSIDKEHGNNPSMIQMMREMVGGLGIDETIARVNTKDNMIARGVPADKAAQIQEIQRMALEYIVYEEPASN